VGSGKCTLLAALHGEPTPAPGAVTVGGCAAYIGQDPWVASEKVQANVLFRRPHEGAHYASALAAAVLFDDVAALPAGDATVLKEKGMTLSGGQVRRTGGMVGRGTWPRFILSRNFPPWVRSLLGDVPAARSVTHLLCPCSRILVLMWCAGVARPCGPPAA